MKVHVPADYPTIQAAVDAAPDGATIEIAAGTWPAAVTIAGRTGLRLTGKDAVLDGGGGPGVAIDQCEGIALTGLTLRNCSSHCLSVSKSKWILLSKCRIEDALLDGAVLFQCTGVGFSRCSFERCANYGIRESDSTSVVVSKCAFRTIGDKAISLSEYGSPGPSGSAIVGNTISGVNNYGILIGASGVVVAKNVLSDIALAGITCDTSGTPEGTRIVKNLIRDTGEQGVILGGVDSLAEKNTVSDTGGAGIELRGENQAAVGNRIARAAGPGIHARGVGPNRVEKNRIDGAADGILMETSGGAILGNKVAGAAEYGIHVFGTGITIDRNTALGIWGDLRDHHAAGVNSYGRNKFGTAFFGDK
ncbi:MAG: right-handed parallel beta-helix repeat-containing protein [Planctomycetes bacterium]|nr:right-handed parallel beta-helix repeat-containing protein [Planctomycetota bacterium]